jgi:hypothetical protein
LVSLLQNKKVQKTSEKNCRIKHGSGIKDRHLSKKREGSEIDPNPPVIHFSEQMLQGEHADIISD